MTSLLLALTRGIWAITPEAAEAFQPIVADILLGKTVDFPKFDASRYTALSYHSAVVSPYSYGGGLNAAQPGSVAIIPLEGAAMKEGNVVFGREFKFGNAQLSASGLKLANGDKCDP